MARIPSKSAKALASVILKFGGAGVAAEGINLDSKTINTLAVQIDIAAELIRAGHLTRASLTVALASEGVGVAGLSDDQRVKCGVALVSASTGVGSFAEAAGVSAVADIATEGGAIPVSTPWVYATGANMVVSLYSVNTDCGPLAIQALDSAKQGIDSAEQGYADLNRGFIEWGLQQQALYR